MDAIDDIASCAEMLVGRRLGAPGRIAVAGRSYGGYATLMSLVHHPDTFAAGIDIAGMSDLLTFFRDTEPWIARAAVTKYGDPARDASLLARLSPLRSLATIAVPLLVIHGTKDTNVPVTEARRLVTRLRLHDIAVDYLELPEEGHELRRAASRLTVLRSIVAFLLHSLDLPGAAP
jgi:dipeptidyl aminopeptidase/acylaminoacyl peptidase